MAELIWKDQTSILEEFGYRLILTSITPSVTLYLSSHIRRLGYQVSAHYKKGSSPSKYKTLGPFTNVKNAKAAASAFVDNM